MHFGVAVFPGSNCDADTYNALKYLGHQVSYLWHAEDELPAVDCVVLPGGFSYGDYLRPGAIARFAKVMEQVTDFANKGGLVLGICNGFQVLTEAGLLPGSLQRNDNLQFRCQWQWLRVEGRDNMFTRHLDGELLHLPIAHGDGSYYLPPDELKGLEARGGVVFRYCDEAGNVSSAANPNGAVANVAAVTNAEGNVLGMMPHPERAVEKILGGTDGQRLFAAIVRGWEARQ
ncbi:MAG: phosphoribosylformylglycinamidine synthase subunit PurQ [Firmicutes bacterium]|nr:phosphoribosylformylglycinamidine synthase subunit PurQ [Bacillota bacterium]